MTEFAPRRPRASSTLVGHARNGWWLFLIRGVLAVVVGIIALVAPGAALAALILLIGSFFIVDGAFAIVKAFRVMRTHGSWVALLLAGVVGVAAGIAVFAWPGLTALTLGVLVGGWAVITGVLEVIVAIALRRAISGEWLYVIFGAISIAFGVYVLVFPGLGLRYLTLLIAFYGFVAGGSLIASALRLRGTLAD